MPYLILAIAIVVGLVLLARGLAGADPRTALKTLKWTAAIAGGAVAVFLAATGQMHIAAMIASAAALMFVRARRIVQFARNMGGPSPGQSSDVETAYLRMSLDHDTGALNGTVLKGPFHGRLLDELSLEESLTLLRDCRVNDAQSAALMESFLDRTHGPEWRGGAGGADHGAGGGGTSGADGAPGGPERMTVDEAYEILGVARDANADEIRDAHRRLMLKNHPDQGGSTYLAAKINQAKELLLGG